MSRSGVGKKECEASYRRRRSRLYQLLAVAHSGPLGQELTGIIRVAASCLFEGEHLPEVPTASRAELYGQVYGHHVGYPNLDGDLTHCLRALPSGEADAPLFECEEGRGAAANA